MVVRNGKLLSLKGAALDRSCLSVDSSLYPSTVDSSSTPDTKGTSQAECSSPGIHESCGTDLNKSSDCLNSSSRTDSSLPYWTSCCTDCGDEVFEDSSLCKPISDDLHTRHVDGLDNAIKIHRSTLQDSVSDELSKSMSELENVIHMDDQEMKYESIDGESKDLSFPESNLPNEHHPFTPTEFSVGVTNTRIHGGLISLEKDKLEYFANVEKNLKSIITLGTDYDPSFDISEPNIDHQQRTHAESSISRADEVAKHENIITYQQALKVSTDRLEVIYEDKMKYMTLINALSNAKEELEFLKLEVGKAKQEAATERENYKQAINELEEIKGELAKETELRKILERRAWEEKQDLLKMLREPKLQGCSFSFEELKHATNNFSDDFKLGEGGYGGVYKGTLNSVDVAIKVLRPQTNPNQHAAIDGWEQFRNEVEVLSCIRHPHIVQLLGVCQEKACLIYEYMENGCLEDRLRCKNGTTPLPWYIRFSICFEVVVALIFLHKISPKPVVHRDIKPGNILLDKNFVSKLSDAGLARCIPNNMTFDRTVYNETNPVGTLAYIDPDYVRTGTFGPHSDIFALGIVIVQVLTGRPPVGVIDLMERAIKEQKVDQVLDPLAGEWPHQEAVDLARLGLLCAEPRRRERPNLVTHVFPFLKRLHEMAQNVVTLCIKHDGNRNDITPVSFICPLSQEVMRNPHIASDGFTYEFLAIKKWIAHHDLSPMTNMKFSHRNLYKNYILDSKIKQWMRELNWKES
ncbi:hypothetical protein KP509_05G032300 [Ceratopteris richardii]|nr:hypothetical protein KP509_05G032300 [Ceratopteris richardii]